MTEHLRRAVVTGASSGIGWAIAERLVTDDWQVVGISRTGQVPEGALSVSADLAGDGVGEAIAQAQNLLGGVDAYVGAAGSTYEQLAARADLEQVNNQLRLHYLANYEAISLLVPGMVRARWGRIVLLSSVVAQSGMAGLSAYGAAKGALEALVKSLALEVGRRAITVNAVAPGYIQTPMTQSLSPRQQERYLQRTGAARAGTPQDVAGPVAFLLSDDAAYINGQILHVDGAMGVGT